MTTRNIKKSLAGTEDLALGIGIVTQERGEIHRVNVFPSSYYYGDMQRYEGGDFFRLFGSDLSYTDYRRNPAGTLGLPASAGGTWEPLTSSDKIIGGNSSFGAYLATSDYVVWHAATGFNYKWLGSYPKTVEPGYNVAADSSYVALPEASLRQELTRDGQSIASIAAQSVVHHSGRAGYANLPRLMQAFTSYDDSTSVEIKILGLGSSVGNGASLPDPATQAPVHYLAQRLNAKLNKLGNKVIKSYNRSEDGSTLNQGITALTNALAEPLIPKLVVVVFGMNDGNTAIYNAGQTYPFVYTNTVAIIEKAKAAGSDVVVLTTPHPHSGRIGWSMHPAIPQLYPTAVAAPVPDAALVPPVSASIKHIDATGDGVVIPVSHRHMRTNEAMRRAAADCGVPTLDAEWYWFKAVGKYGEDALFNVGETVHPNKLGHELSYQLAINDFIDSLSASVLGNTQQSDYQQRLVAGLAPGQTPGARNHLRQSELNTAEKVLRVDNSAGTRGYEVDLNGDITPIETINSVWTWPRVTQKKLIYPGGSPIIYSKEMLDVVFNFSAVRTLFTTKTDGLTELIIKATNSGIGAGWQILKYMVNNKSGVLSLQSMLNIGDTIVTLSASGADVRITPVAANTNITFELKEIYSV